MNTYQIPLRNDTTGEVRLVEVQDQFAQNALFYAVSHYGDEFGWKSITADLNLVKELKGKKRDK